MLATRMLRDPIFSSFGMLEDLLERGFWFTRNGEQRWSPPVDVKETKDHYLVLVDLPGVEPDTVTIEVENGVLTIAGDRSELRQEEGETVFRIERPYGRFQRLLRLPEGCDLDKVAASFRNGVLEVRLPKAVERVPKRIPITSQPRLEQKAAA